MIPWFLWIAGCVTPDEIPKVRRPDVLLVTLDTTRADRIGAYGHASAATDHLDALAARGRRYDAAFTTAPLTIPAHASILTGRYPAEVGVRANGDAALADEERTLAEHFRSAGYRTAASVGAFVTTREWGFAQGFGKYFDDVPRGAGFWHGERPADAVVDDLLRYLEQRDPTVPVFAWAHLYDAHAPFQTGEPWLSEVQGDPYDAEIARLDDELGRLLEGFDLDHTVVVVVGDHGEALGQHGELAHGLFLYDGVARVPWIVAGPGVRTEIVDAPVSLVDVAPTVVALAGLRPMPGASGQVVPGGGGPRAIESWQLAQRFGVAPHLAVVDDGYKLIDLPRPELYRLEDRAEAENLADSEPARVAAMREALRGFGFAPPSADPAHPATAAQIRQLEALGYVQSGFAVADGPLVDPKERGALLEKAQLLELRLRQRKSDEAAALISELAEDWPEVVEFQLQEANRQARAGDVDGAVARVRALLEREPDHVVATHVLGTLLAMRGDFEEASALFHDAADRMPWAPRLRVMAVKALFEVDGGEEAALELAVGYLRDDPSDAALAGVLGVEMVRRGKLEEGLKLLEQGMHAEPPERDVAYLLSAASLGRGDRARAEELLRRELETDPTHARAEMALLRLLAKRGAWDRVYREAERWLAGPGRVHFAPEHQPPGPDGLPVEALPAAASTAPAYADFYLWVAQARFNLKQYDQARLALDRALAIGPERPEVLLLDANLLQQEGDSDAARARFEEARARKAATGAAPDPWSGRRDPGTGG